MASSRTSAYGCLRLCRDGDGSGGGAELGFVANAVDDVLHSDYCTRRHHHDRTVNGDVSGANVAPTSGTSSPVAERRKRFGGGTRSLDHRDVGETTSRAHRESHQDDDHVGRVTETSPGVVRARTLSTGESH